jgi:P4 family phage/plasmid primase-like protien
MTTDLDSLKASVDMVSLLTNYGVELKQRGQEYDALCIFHNETKPSMQVYIKDGIQRVHCKSCGAGGTVIDVVMEMDSCDEAQAIVKLKANGFQRDETRIKSEAPIKPAKWQHQVAPTPLTDFDVKDRTYVKHWTYLDATGALLGYVVRYLQPDGSKDYRPWTFGSYSENASAKWASKTWTHGRRPLYGLDLLANNPKGKVVICEGEKAADAARHYWTSRIGIAWPGGANSIAGIDWQPLAGRDVLLIPDADISGAGVSAMYNVTSYLLPLGCKVSILDTSDKPNKWDVADALAEGMSKDDLMAWAAQRITPLTSNELEKQRVKEEKKTMQSAQSAQSAQAADPYREFDEDSSIYELPPLEDEPEPQHIPMTIDVVPEQIPDAPSVQPAKVKRHTAIKEEMVLQPGSPFSDRRMAEIFAENDGIDWQYCHGWEKWLQWDGNRWEIDQTRSACRIVSKLTQAAEYWPQADQLSAKDKRALSSVGKITSVLKAATWIPELKKLPKDFDADTFLLGTPGGTVDLRTGILRESKREDWITKQTAVTPQAGPMPLWEKMLDRCTMGDPAMRTYYQKWAGYALTGDTREKGFLFVHGAQDSGKTSFLTTLKSMMGEYAAEIKVDILMEQKYGGAAAHDLAELYGIRLAMTTEPQSGHRWNESLVKSMTGGEELQACRKYEHPFSFKVTHKIFMGGNEKPMLSSADGMERRLHIAEFPNSIPLHEQIPKIEDKLKDEWPAILAWAIEGCLLWQKEGLAKPDAVKNAVREYVDMQDIIHDWLSEKTEKCDSKVKQTDLYASYSAYIKAAGMGALGSTRLGPELKKRGYIQQKSNGVRYWFGLQMLDHVQLPSWVDNDNGNF